MSKASDSHILAASKASPFSKTHCAVCGQKNNEREKRGREGKREREKERKRKRERENERMRE